jgi:hypothetical protein
MKPLWEVGDKGGYLEGCDTDDDADDELDGGPGDGARRARSTLEWNVKQVRWSRQQQHPQHFSRCNQIDQTLQERKGSMTTASKVQRLSRYGPLTLPAP